MNNEKFVWKISWHTSFKEEDRVHVKWERDIEDAFTQSVIIFLTVKNVHKLSTVMFNERTL